MEPIGSDLQLVVSGFCDEISSSKNIGEQFAVATALGLTHVSLRFVDVGTGPKNVLQLNDAELDIVSEKLVEYDLRVASLGSPIGKVKLVDDDDGSANVFRPADDYLQVEVDRAIAICRRLGTRRLRGFSFYPPRGSLSRDLMEMAAARIREIVKRCSAAGLIFGMEVEANLIGHDAASLLEIIEHVDDAALVVVFDGANLVTQGFRKEDVLRQWERLRPHVGWLHVKDYRAIRRTESAWIDEAALNQYVPVGLGEAGYPELLGDLRDHWAEFAAKLHPHGLTDFVLDLEPHLKRGGQFGGYSGPDGFGVALRALMGLLDQAKLGYRLRGWSELRLI